MRRNKAAALDEAVAAGGAAVAGGGGVGGLFDVSGEGDEDETDPIKIARSSAATREIDQIMIFTTNLSLRAHYYSQELLLL